MALVELTRVLPIGPAVPYVVNSDLVENIEQNANGTVSIFIESGPEILVKEPFHSVKELLGLEEV